MFGMMHKCDLCGGEEERMLQDTWTGKNICLDCVGQIWDKLTNSPASERDNLQRLAKDLA